MPKKWSKFNRLIDRQGKFLLYNSLSNSFAELDKELYDSLIGFKPGDKVALEDEDVIDFLKSSKSIVHSDEYELSKIKYATRLRRFDNNRLVLTINPTLACNFRCPYCFEHTHSGKTMTDEVEDRVFETIKSMANLKSIGVTWFGGEPLLAFDRIESLSKKFLSLGIAYHANIITNGYLITEDIASKLKELCISSVQITIDGLAERHNSRRCLANGNPTFDRIIQSIRILTEVSPDTNINIRVNVDNDNKAEFIEVFRYLTQRFGKQLRIDPAFTSDATDTGYACICSKNEKKEFYTYLLKNVGINYSAFYPGEHRTECAVRSSASFIIGPEGELYSCWNDVGNPAKVFGTIDGPITNELEYLKYKTDADPLEDAECQDCLLFPVCNGGCPYERIKRLEKGENPNDCPLMKNELDDYLWMHYQFKTGNLHQKS